MLQKTEVRRAIHVGELPFNNGTVVEQHLQQDFMKSVAPWMGYEDYLSAKRYIWKVDREVAGYVKLASKLVEIMVRNAGHLVPGDYPKWAQDLITRFTNEKSFSSRKQ
ncbi:hypothetical protein ACJJTC_019274 [Scirpophaga incertulas]